MRACNWSTVISPEFPPHFGVTKPQELSAVSDLALSSGRVFVARINPYGMSGCVRAGNADEWTRSESRNHFATVTNKTPTFNLVDPSTQQGFRTMKSVTNWFFGNETLRSKCGSSRRSSRKKPMAPRLQTEALESRQLFTVSSFPGPIQDPTHADQADTICGAPVTIDVVRNDPGRIVTLGGGITITTNDPPDRSTVRIGRTPVEGTAVVLANGTVRYTPSVQVNSDHRVTFTYVVSGARRTWTNSEETVTVDLSHGVIANDDVWRHDIRNGDGTVIYDVLANDGQPTAAKPLKIAAFPTQSARGGVISKVVGSGSDKLQYTQPANAEVGQIDSFEYTAIDRNGCTSQATVNLTFYNPPTPAPPVVANNDLAVTHNSAEVIIPVLKNDVGLQVSLIPESVSTPANGVLSFTENGDVIYTPRANWAGQDSFKYAVRDAHGQVSQPGTVTVNVTGITSTVSALMSDATVRTRYMDWNGDSVSDLVLLKTTETASGKTELHVLSGAGPNPFHTFLVQTATWFGPVADNVDFDFTDWDGDGRLDLIGFFKNGNFTDPFNPVVPSPRVWFYVTTAADGFNNLVGWSPTWFTELTTEVPAFQFFMRDWDHDGLQDVIALKKAGTGSDHTEVHVVGASSNWEVPILHAASALPEPDGTYDFEMIQWNTDGAWDIAAVKKGFTASNATEVRVLDGASNYGQFLHQELTQFPETDAAWEFGFERYRPDLNRPWRAGGIQMSGSSSGAMEVWQSVELSDFPVSPSGDHFSPPVTESDFGTTLKNTPLVISPLANDVDPDGGGLYLVAVNTSSLGSVSIVDPQTVLFEPAFGFAGDVTIHYTVADDNGGVAEGTAVLSVDNRTPTAHSDSVSTYFEQAIAIDVLGNDLDADGDSLSLEIVNQPAQGTVTILPDNSIRYVPPPNAIGDETFSYKITDSSGGTDEAEVHVSINPPLKLFGDFDEDGIVGLPDLNIVRNHFGDSGTDLPMDANFDGEVGLYELNLVRNNFGTATFGVETNSEGSPSIRRSSQADASFRTFSRSEKLQATDAVFQDFTAPASETSYIRLTNSSSGKPLRHRHTLR